MNVWIVCPPLVVIVPPVEEVDTQSLQSVAYDIITIPLHPLHQGKELVEPHPPHHLFAVQFCAITVQYQFHPPQFHQAHQATHTSSHHPPPHQ